VVGDEPFRLEIDAIDIDHVCSGTHVAFSVARHAPPTTQSGRDAGILVALQISVVAGADLLTPLRPRLCFRAWIGTATVPGSS
jgi:hypothetical protein